MKETYEAFEAVKKFHELNQQVISEQLNMKVPRTTQLLRARLISEEFGETTVAMHEADEVKTADGLADLLYVLVGTSVSYGHRLCDYWLDPYPPANRDDTKWYFLRYVTRGMSQLFEAIRHEEADDFITRLSSLTYQVNLVASRLNLPMRECFLEAHRSNLSKKLGGAVDGKKYGDGGGKSASYVPPDFATVLRTYRTKGLPSPLTLGTRG